MCDSNNIEKSELPYEECQQRSEDTLSSHNYNNHKRQVCIVSSSKEEEENEKELERTTC